MQKRHMYGTATALAVTGLLGLGSSVNADPVMPSNPVSGWTFNDTLDDAFGGNHGTAPNGMQYVEDGPFGGKALDLTGNAADGDGDKLHVNIGNPESLQLTTNMTVATWVRTDGIGTGNDYVIAKFQAGDRQWAMLTWYAVERFVVTLSEDGSNNKDARPNQDLSRLDDNQWHHLAFSIDEVNGPTLYIDGVKITDEDWHTANTGAVLPRPGVTQLYNGSADIVVGARSDLTSGDYFTGQIGETAIWDQVLSDDEIAWLSQNSIAVIPEPGSMGLLGTGAAMLFFRRRR